MLFPPVEIQTRHGVRRLAVRMESVRTTRNDRHVGQALRQDGTRAGVHSFCVP